MTKDPEMLPLIILPPITPEREQEIIDDMVLQSHRWNAKALKEFIACTKEELGGYHHTMGQHIRNHYGLWRHKWKPVIKDGCDCSEQHPDQVFMRIIKALQQSLKFAPRTAEQETEALRRIVGDLEFKVQIMWSDFQALALGHQDSLSRQADAWKALNETFHEASQANTGFESIRTKQPPSGKVRTQ